MKSHKKIYKAILDILAESSPDRRALIAEVVGTIAHAPHEHDSMRALVGSILTEMTDNGVVLDAGGVYSLASSKPVALRMESCAGDMVQRGAPLRHGARDISVQ